LSDFIKELKKGKITNLWDLEDVSFKVKRLFLFGQSFSGAISCGLVAIEKCIDKLVLFSPVWDFNKHNKFGDEQDLGHLVPFVKRAYPNLYRFEFNSLVDAVSKYKEVSPSFYGERIKIPIMVLNDPKDKTVSIRHSESMSKIIENLTLVKHDQGHGFNVKLLEDNWKKIKKYLDE
jgi:cephalosporin-C deacetylase-like acetyl esterase